MANENLTNKAILEEVFAKALADIEQIEASLKPYLITLTKEQRTNRSSMGDKSVAFVFKAHESAMNQPQLVPPYIDTVAWAIDIELVDQLKTLNTKVSSFNELLSDTRLEAGIEAYNMALVLYTSLKAATRVNVAAKPIVDDLSKRFLSRKRNTAPTEEK